MNTITLTIAATPANLMKLAQAFGDSIDGILGAEDVPVTQYQDKVRTPEGSETKPGEIHPKDPEAEQALADPVPKPEEPKAQPEPKPEEKPEEKKGFFRKLFGK